MASAGRGFWKSRRIRERKREREREREDRALKIPTIHMLRLLTFGN